MKQKAFGPNNNLNILIISTNNPYKTSGIVALDLFKSFKELNFNVKLIVKIYDKYEKDIIPIQGIFKYKASNYFEKFNRKVINRILRNKIRTDLEYHVQDINQRRQIYSTKRILKKTKFKPDVVILIFCQNFLTARNIYELNKFTGAPVYWQLADMAPFTGLCHYSWDCDRYISTCGKCPAIYSNDYNDISNKNILFIKKYIQMTNLRIITGSDWLLKKATQSSVFSGKPFSKIFLSVDDSKFNRSNNKSGINSKFGIKEGSYVIAFGATQLMHKRKGIKFIIEALNHLYEEEGIRNIFAIYSGDQSLQADLKPDSRFLGRLSREKLPQFYRSADLFISASLQDVGPYMINESLMCGVPVVSFNTGCANEFVITGKTGFLVKEISSQSLAEGIKFIMTLNSKTMDQMKSLCSLRTTQMLRREKQVQGYIKLFEEDGLIGKINE